MNTHVTIQEAVSETGKSASTIRRAIKRLSKDAIKEQDGKYLVERSALFAALGLTTLNSQNEQAEQVSSQSSQVDIQPSQMSSQPPGQVSSQSSQTDIVAILTEQLRIKDEQIAQLLERQRETNVLMNNLRLLTTAKPDVTPTGKSEAEVRRDTIFMYVALGIVLVILALIVWASWR